MKKKKFAYLSFTDFTVSEFDLENATGTVVHKNDLNIVYLLLDYLSCVLRDSSALNYVGFNLD